MQETSFALTALSPSAFLSQQKENSHRLRALLGGAAGLFMESLLYPIDTMLTRMKANTQESVTLRAQMKSMYRQEGLSSFFRGYSCVLTGSFAGNAAYFYIYEKMKYTLSHRDLIPEDMSPFIAAFTAGIMANSLALPYIVVKTRMQLKPGEYHYKNFFDGARQMIKREGFSKLYLGGQVYIPQASIETGLTFGFYEIFHKLLAPVFPTKKDFNLPLSVACSMAASVSTGVVLHPLEVVVTRLQAMNTNLNGSISALNMVKMIYKKEGLGGFMKGLTGTISLYGMSFILLFPTYEFLKGTFNVDLSE